jgi:hypothetical protein
VSVAQILCAAIFAVQNRHQLGYAQSNQCRHYFRFSLSSFGFRPDKKNITAKLNICQHISLFKPNYFHILVASISGIQHLVLLLKLERSGDLRRTFESMFAEDTIPLRAEAAQSPCEL